MDRIRLKLVFQFIDETVKGFANVEHIAPLIKRLDKRIGDLDKVLEVSAAPQFLFVGRNFTIVSLRNVSMAMKKVLPLLLCKHLYDEKKSIRDESKFLNIIIDEAHNILSYTSEGRAKPGRIID